MATASAPDEGGGGGAPAGLWRRLSRSRLRALLAAGLGAGAGVAYALLVGCRTGTCPITSSPFTAGLYGAVVGALAGWPSREARGR